MKWSSVLARLTKGGIGTALVVFGCVIAFSFYRSFLPNEVLFSNDGPLGRLMSESNRLPGRFFGCWADLNNIGFNSGAASPGISFILQWLLGPVLFSKFYTIISLLILGVGAWCFFNRLGLAPAACILGGLAAMLTSTLFSLACWGLGAQVIAAGLFFLALAALVDAPSPLPWLRVVLAGFATGMVVMEGADVGVIFSLLIALFVVYQALIADGARIKNLAVSAGRLVLVVLCAAFLAIETVHELVSTDIQGISGTKQDVQTKEQRWNWATQWSLPKAETLGLLVPGLFGYALDTPGGGEYWGLGGHDMAWDDYVQNGQKGQPPTGFYRYTGGGNYLGVLVILVAFWAAVQLFRSNNSIFSPRQKKWLWFWLVIGIISLLLALGRYAPFYALLYHLPYFSTIRNPTKFLYTLSFATVILFAFGIDGLWRKYLSPSIAVKAGQYEKKFAYGCALVWGVSLLAWYVYAQHFQELENYLLSAHLTGSASAAAQFSIRQPEWFALFFFLAAGLLALIFNGVFSGKHAGTAVLLLGLLLVGDLLRANLPWIKYWDYPYKYASNPLVDFLKEKPYEHRVVIAPITWPGRMEYFHLLYKNEWMEQLFPINNIQTFDVVEMPRIPMDFAAFQGQFNRGFSLTNGSRAYQLTDTRYVLAPADFGVFWNQQIPGAPINIIARFNLDVKPGLSVATHMDELTVTPSPNGTYGLFELASALPRARLYSQWQVNTNDTDVLHQLFSPQFDPHGSVFVAENVPASPAPGATNPPDDAVQIASYAPKDIVLKANAATPSILLLNDHYHSDWKVMVDGAPEKLLRCNFLMRGVYLLPGSHMVEFKFLPPHNLLYVSAAADVIALAGLGIFIFATVKSRPPVPVAPLPATAPVSATATATPSKRSNKPATGSRKKLQRK
jgi:hypothetical protein